MGKFLKINDSLYYNHWNISLKSWSVVNFRTFLVLLLSFSIKYNVYKIISIIIMYIVFNVYNYNVYSI